MWLAFAGQLGLRRSKFRPKLVYRRSFQQLTVAIPFGRSEGQGTYWYLKYAGTGQKLDLQERALERAKIYWTTAGPCEYCAILATFGAKLIPPESSESFGRQASLSNSIVTLAPSEGKYVLPKPQKPSLAASELFLDMFG